MLFEDTFTVTDVNPEGKKFDKGKNNKKQKKKLNKRNIELYIFIIIY